MKNLIIGFALALAISAKAQVTNDVPTLPPQHVFDVAMQYFTSFDTSLASTWTNHHGTFFAAAEFEQGAHAGSQLGLSYSIYKGFGARGTVHFADLTGATKRLDLGIEYGYNIVDVKLSGYIVGGFDEQTRKGYCEVGVTVAKALTQHTYVFTGLAGIIERSAQPKMYVGTGITF